MFFKTISVLALAVAGVYSHAVPLSRCGAPEPGAAIKAVAKAQVAKYLADQAAGVAQKRSEIVVDTWFHVLRSGNTTLQGNVPDEQIQAQFDVLNADFASTGVSFVLKGITRTTNNNYFNDRDEYAMKASLRKGDYKTLNIYLQNLSGGLLGYCYFPVQNPSNEDILMDGCAVLYTSLPGGTATNYDLGRTATHEIGHWFGLFHTFQNGCAASAAGGDGVADTPAEASPAFGCPTGRDTCKGTGFEGVDPIHNYMDYTYDSCMDNFSAGQAARIQDFWPIYRDSSDETPETPEE